MRHVLLTLSILLLGLSWAAAQDTSSQASPSSSGYGQTRSSAGAEKTVEGCLSGSNGSYTLTDKNGTTYQLTGDTAKLSDHVGHEVKITGAAGSEASGSGMAGGTAGSSASQTLQVSSVKHISKTCKSSGGGMSH
jgi:hypothetical protein